MSCKNLMEAILNLTSIGYVVKFEDDCFPNSLTIWINDSHTHIGPAENIDQLMEWSYNALVGGSGLSFVKD